MASLYVTDHSVTPRVKYTTPITLRELPGKSGGHFPHPGRKASRNGVMKTWLFLALDCTILHCEEVY